MRNIFFFIRRFSHLLFFLLLQGFSIYLIVHYSKYHNAIASGWMNEITGRINDQYSAIRSYVGLKQENERLMQDNERLRNERKENFTQPDTINRIYPVNIPVDTLWSKRKWLYRMASVDRNSVNQPDNYLVINRGLKQQLNKDMAVVNEDFAVVGVITDISDNYAVVMSLLHKDSRIDAKLFKSGETGTLSWDGKRPNLLQLSRIPKSAKVMKGDSVITSGFSGYFPKGLLIGLIEEVVPDKGSSNFIITVRTAANFYNLQYVYAIDNLQKMEADRLLEKIKKSNQ